MANAPLAHVLIIEDDSELLEILKFVLEEAGYKVSVSTTGKDVLDLVESEPVDLAILDVDLQGTSGLDVARDLRAWSGRDRRLLIALHTGLEENKIREQFLDYDLFMPKMDDSNKLLELVAGVLTKSDIDVTVATPVA